jgi:hypothetical protein
MKNEIKAGAELRWWNSLTAAQQATEKRRDEETEAGLSALEPLIHSAAPVLKSESAPAPVGGNATRYMQGVFTPLDSDEVQKACRALWDELDSQHAARLAERDRLRKSLQDVIDALDDANFHRPEQFICVWRCCLAVSQARAALNQAGVDKQAGRWI